MSGSNVVPDASFMQIALELARSAGQAGEVPVGAVVTYRGDVIGRGANARVTGADPTAHAELVALREAAKVVGNWQLTGATLYVTLEPCPMCAGALVAARVSRLVFAAPDPKSGACGSLYNLCADPRLNHEVAVEHGVLEEDARQLLVEWFAERRSAVSS